MEFHVMRETPEQSGKYEEIGKVFGTLEDAGKHAAELAAQGGRYALRIFESMRTDAAHAADRAATQAEAHQRTATAAAAAAPKPPVVEPSPAGAGAVQAGPDKPAAA